MTITKYLYGHLTGFGLVVALVVAAADQLTKLWLLITLEPQPGAGFSLSHLLELALIRASEAQFPAQIRVGPFFTLLLTWNTGISYGLLTQVGPLGQWALLGVKAVAVLLLWAWLAHAGSRLTALALGLIIGGAVGNGIDRVLHGAVMDFVLFHVTAETWTFNWYVFNLADVAIVAGVIGLLYDSVVARDAAKAP
jgi:signal peptidase II